MARSEKAACWWRLADTEAPMAGTLWEPGAAVGHKTWWFRVL